MFLVWIVSTLLTTAILACVMWTVSRFLKNRPAVIHALWVLVLIRFIIPPIPYCSVDLPFLSQMLSSTQLQQSVGSNGYPFANQSLSRAPIEAKAAPWEDSIASIAGILLQVAFFVWATGSLWIFCRLIWHSVLMRRCISKGRPAPHSLKQLIDLESAKAGISPMSIVIVDSISTPFVWCFGKPILIWPQDMVDRRFHDVSRLIAAHEVSHIARRDHLIAWLETMMCILWWWNPVFWFVRRNLRLAAELTCDSRAIERYPAERGVYAQTLLNLSLVNSTVPNPGLAVRPVTANSLEQRILLMTSEDVSSRLTAKWLLLPLTLAIVSVPMVATSQTVEKTFERSSDTAFREQNLRTSEQLASLHEQSESSCAKCDCANEINKQNPCECKPNQNCLPCSTNNCANDAICNDSVQTNVACNDSCR